jgi:FAD/FMN-containing dehydrogenase
MQLGQSLREIVGDGNVFDSPKDLAPYSKDYSLTPPGMPNFVVKPKDAQEIQQILKLANEHKIPVIPVSSAVHFYGATIPSQGGIVLDLRRMNKIQEINELDRLARIEPGVTWEQLQSELAKRGYRSMTPLLPHSQNSVLTSWLERDMPLNPRYEYAEPHMTTEVVWPNGEIMRTGSASTPGYPDDTSVKGGYTHGPGLDWFRLVQGAQGTMGVVTWMNVKFEYLPKWDKTYFLPFSNVEDTIEPTYAIQRRMIGNECIILNRLNAAIILAEKWPDDFENVYHLLPEWLFILVLSNSPRRPEEKLAYEEEALTEIITQFPRIVEPQLSIPGLTGAEFRLPSMLRQPWPDKQTYWKHRLTGGCQDLFFITKLEYAPEFVYAMNQQAIEVAYPSDKIGCHIQPIEQGRACRCEFNLYYDPDNPDEVTRVYQLYEQAAKQFISMDAMFTEPYGILADLVYEKANSYTTMLKQVKNLFDPNNIMCPGNLCF